MSNFQPSFNDGRHHINCNNELFNIHTKIIQGKLIIHTIPQY